MIHLSDYKIKAKEGPKPRSFLPIFLLGGGLWVCVGLILGLVVKVDCEDCFGVAYITVDEIIRLSDNPTVLQGHFKARDTTGKIDCKWCEGIGQTNLLRKLFQNPPGSEQSKYLLMLRKWFGYPMRLGRGISPVGDMRHMTEERAHKLLEMRRPQR